MITNRRPFYSMRMMILTSNLISDLILSTSRRKITLSHEIDGISQVLQDVPAPVDADRGWLILSVDIQRNFHIA